MIGASGTLAVAASHHAPAVAVARLLGSDQGDRV